jgi:hypothetical protein
MIPASGHACQACPPLHPRIICCTSCQYHLPVKSVYVCLCSLQLDSLKQHAAELQQQADEAAAALAAAPAADKLAAAESAAAEAAQQAQLTAAKLEALEQQIQTLRQERDNLQHQLGDAQLQLASAVQRQNGSHSILTNDGASVLAGKLHSPANTAAPQLPPEAADTSSTGVCLLCCMSRGLCRENYCESCTQWWPTANGKQWTAIWHLSYHRPACLLLQRSCRA